MANTDLFGKPIGGYPVMTLSLWQKRQAALLDHWMSLDYLKGLKALIDALIQGADVHLALAQRQGRDALIANERWGVRDTAANWSTYVLSALEDFRQSTTKLISWRINESYCGTGANQCGRMIQEHSSLWMTPEEEAAFSAQFEEVYRYASKIDDVCGAGGGKYLDDFSMALAWEENQALFPRLPKFRVRTDVEAVTGKKPIRTGLYVAQDDPNATLQFAWTGNSDGILGEAMTFNDLGLKTLATIGRQSLWVDGDAMLQYAKQPEIDAILRTDSAYRFGVTQNSVKGMLAAKVFTTRPCKWYFVEKVEGEFDDEPEEASIRPRIEVERLKVEGGLVCPKEGWYKTPAIANSRRYFKVGEVMPKSMGSDYGQTIWQWDEQQ
jgi:hypothetical protein